MRLLVFTAFYPPHHAGGYELRCQDVLTRLAQRGHDVLVLTTRCPTPSCGLHVEEQGVLRVLHQKHKETSLFQKILHDRADLTRIEQIIHGWKPDLFYLWHVQNLSSAILPYLSTTSTPIVIDEGGNTTTYLHNLLRRGLYFGRSPRDLLPERAAKTLIENFAKAISRGRIHIHCSWPQHLTVYFNSQSGKELALSAGTPVEGAPVIPSAVDLNLFSYQWKQGVGSPIRLILPARIDKEKGILDAVRLVKALYAAGCPAKLTVLGDVKSTEYNHAVQAEIQACQMEESVCFLPMLPRQELSRYYHEADICFFPSYAPTGNSRVPLEAMASGCLVITYGNEGSRAIVSDRETGYIVPEGDILAAARVIVELSQNQRQFQTIARNARHEVEHKYGIEQYISDIESLLTDALQNPPARNTQHIATTGGSSEHSLLLFSVVICTYNRAHLLSAALQSVLSQTISPRQFEVIIVDNGSTDDTRAVVREWQSKYRQHDVRYLYEEEPGSGVARFAGIQAARASWVAFLDDDAQAAPNWLKNATKTLHAQTGLDGMGGKILPFYLDPPPEWFLDRYETYSWGHAPRLLQKGEAFAGSNMFFRRDLLEKIGAGLHGLGMIGDKMFYGEDTVLFERAWDMIGQAKFYYDPAICVRHAATSNRMSISYILQRQFSIGASNFMRNGPKKLFPRILFVIHHMASMLRLATRMLFQRHRYPRRENWLVECGGPVVKKLGLLSAAFGLRIRFTQTSHVQTRK